MSFIKKNVNMDTKQLCHEVCELAREVGDFLVGERRKLHGVVDSQSKGIHDYVTCFDKESERRIVERLRMLLPDSGFIAEEGTAGASGRERFTWIVDPLDGTTNYIHGLAPTCVSIGLQDNMLSAEHHAPVMTVGVVHEIWANECFWACDGIEGAFLNDANISVSSTPALSDSLVATGFPYVNFSLMPEYMRFLEWTMRNTHGVRRLGSAAADLVYTACGRTDAFYEYGLKPYDVAAGAYIVEKAGGRVGDFRGGPNWLHGGEMVAGNRLIFDELVEQLNFFGMAEKK